MSTFLKEISDYLRELSEKHVDVLHAANNYAFCRMDDQAAFNQIRNNAAKNVVLIESFYGNAFGAYDDNMVRPTVIIKFSAYAKTLSSAEITLAVDKSLSILIDFWIRMRKDSEDYDDGCPWLRFIDWSNIQFEPIEQPWLQNHYGWDLVIPYKTHLPEYNEAKWNE